MQLFSRAIFDRCLPQAVEDLYETPMDLWIPGAAGPKFNVSTNRVRAVIVEYDAEQIFSFSHTDMDKFNKEVSEWCVEVFLDMQCS